MPQLTTERIRELLLLYLREPAAETLCMGVSRYLDLLAQWNRKVSLTSVGDPVQIVQRHFGEGFFLAERLPAFQTLMDFGSGAGFPGIPVAFLHPEKNILLVESQHKKASFLREAISALDLPAKVFAGRGEQMPPQERFDIVTLRAVDNMQDALAAAAMRVRAGGTLAYFAGEGTPALQAAERWHTTQEFPLPCSTGKVVLATSI